MATKEFGGKLQSNQEVTIGIDQSLTGFALSVVSVELPSEHHTWVYKSPYKGVQRLDDIASWITNRIGEVYLNKNVVRNIAMEGTVLQSQAASILGELAGITKLELFTFFDYRLNPNSAVPLQIPPMTLKKYATGKGTAKKQEMLLQIYKRWGVEFNDDNAADAYALARLARDAHVGESGELFDKIKDGAYRDLVQ
jgi:Holliday junction resolvasome RuvABC endonuclease subunit